ncbi:hypothetical protein BgiBS90_015522, partial [Biomphalaria glabrata]
VQEVELYVPMIMMPGSTQSTVNVSSERITKKNNDDYVEGDFRTGPSYFQYSRTGQEISLILQF